MRYGVVFEVVSYLKFLKVSESLGQPDPTSLVYISSDFQLAYDQIQPKEICRSAGFQASDLSTPLRSN